MRTRRREGWSRHSKAGGSIQFCRIAGRRPREPIDWLIEKNGKTFAGNARDRRAYYAYGKPVLAVADGRVVKVRDGFAENVPGHGDAFHPPVPITMDTVRTA